MHRSHYLSVDGEGRDEEGREKDVRRWSGSWVVSFASGHNRLLLTYQLLGLLTSLPSNQTLTRDYSGQYSA